MSASAYKLLQMSRDPLQTFALKNENSECRIKIDDEPKIFKVIRV